MEKISQRIPGASPRKPLFRRTKKAFRNSLLKKALQVGARGFELDSVSDDIATVSVESVEAGGAKCGAFRASSPTVGLDFVEAGGAKCGAFRQISCEIDTDLQAVIDAWPGLSPETRAEVVAVIEAARGQGR